MWPFKQKKKLTDEEYAASKPEAPCGEQTEHYFWTDFYNFPCPVCKAISEKKKKEEDENRMAEKIATAVIRQLNAEKL